MFRNLSRASSRQRARLPRSTVLVAAGSAALAATVLTSKVSNDATVDPAGKASASNLRTQERVKEIAKGHENDLKVFSWGSNPAGSNSSGTTPRLPAEATQLSGYAFRDIVAHENYAAAVDASGDVYVWSSQSNKGVHCLAKGKDIKTITASPTRIFALSSHGRVYSFDPSSTTTSIQPPSSWISWLWGSAPDDESINTSVPLHLREKFTSISAGRDHLLAVTSSGRAFALPITLAANVYGQLGTRKVQVTPSASLTTEPMEHTTLELSPRVQADPYAYSSPYVRSTPASAENPSTTGSEPQLVPCLYELPSLRGVPISKVAANERSSYALTTHGGRILSWGANEYGQLGLGASAIVPIVSVPTEIPLFKTYGGGRSVTCTDIVAGGDAAYFVVESTSDLPNDRASTTVDVLACGMGQYGALGNASYVQAQSTPVKTKVISGNVRYNESTNAVEPIRPHVFSVSPTSSNSGAHALFSLSSGHDLLAWGSNSSYQLGNGKRSNVAIPTYVRDFALTASGVSEEVDKDVERQGRMTLGSQTLKDLRDLSGRSVGRNIKVQQWPVAGCNSSLVYWRIID